MNSKKRRILVPDFSRFVEGLAISGVGKYGGRDLVRPVDSCVLLGGDGEEEEATRRYVNYLNGMKIGAREVRFVRDPSDIPRGILNCSQTRRWMHERVHEEGCIIEGFSPSSSLTHLFEELTVPDGQRGVANLEMVQDIDDKFGFRQKTKELGLQDHVPPHIVGYGYGELLQGIRTMLEQHQVVYVQRPDLEGGDGTLRVDRTTNQLEILSYLKRYCTGQPLLISKGIVPSKCGRFQVVEASVQWKVEEDGVHPWIFTRQYINGTAHEGNLVCQQHADVLPEHLSAECRQRIVDYAWKKSRVLAEYLHKQNYRKYLGVDLIIRVDVESETFDLYMLEVNARSTGATPVGYVMEQAVASGVQNTCVAALVCHPHQTTDHWEKALAVISDENHPDSQGNLAYIPGEAGVIVGQPQLFFLDAPKGLIWAIASTPKMAEDLLHCAKKRLQKTPYIRPVALAG